MKKRMGKKGQDLSIGTLILIVLGIIVLVLLILGFSMGWSNLWAKINIFGGGGKSDISAMVTACNLAVISNSVYDYCNDFKEVNVDGKKEWVNCEDSRVASGVDTKLTCPNGDENSRVKEKCISLMESKKIKEDTKINQKICWDEYDCDSVGGTPKPKCADDEDSFDKNQINTNEASGNYYCCIPKSP